MRPKSPSFTYQNVFGVFYFQRRIPTDYRRKTPSLPTFVRLSLGTKNLKDSRRLSRTLSVMLDLRQKQYFNSEESFHRGMKILQEYLKKNVDTLNLTEMEEVLFGLIDDTTDDINLLERSLNYRNSMLIDQGKDPYSNQLTVLTEMVKKLQTTSSNVVTRESVGVPLEDSFEEFIKIKRVNWKDVGGMEQTFRQSYFPFLREVFGPCLTGDLKKSHVNELIKILQSTPSNRHKIAEYKDLSLRDFLKISVPKDRLLSSITLKRYLNQFSTYLKWLKSVDYSLIDLVEPIKNVKVKVARSQEHKDRYSKDELGKLFNSEEYCSGTHKKASHFWVPLIGLYTGARLNEICQLSISDCYEEKSITRWVFNFNEEFTDGVKKSIKRSHHQRLVPIHKRLIDLGLLDFLKLQKSKNETRLFPELPYVSDTNKYGDKLQKWFNRTYKKNCGITSTKTSFHSLRHTVITHLVNEKEVDPNKIAIGLGQSVVGGVTQTTYTKSLHIKEYLSHFDKINFDDCFDVKKIRRWDYHLFNRS